MKHANHIRFVTAGLITPLWDLAVSLIARLMPMIGSARVLEPRAWRAASRWLADVEALARRVLFAQAAALARGMKAPKKAMRAAAPSHAPAPGEGWRRNVFRLRLGGARHGSVAPRGRRAPPSYATALLLDRIDALNAVIDDPAPCAMKLARRLARRRECVPDMLHALRRKRPHPALREELSPVFTEPLECLIGRCAAPSSGTDPPMMAFARRSKTTVQDARRLRAPAKLKGGVME